MFGLRKRIRLALPLLALAGMLAAAGTARAEKVGDVKLTVTGVVKGTSKAKADVLIANKTGELVPMTADDVSLPIAIGDEMALQLKPGTKHVTITEYRWSYLGTGDKLNQGWVKRNTKTIDVGLGLRGSPAKYVVMKPKKKCVSG